MKLGLGIGRINPHAEFLGRLACCPQEPDTVLASLGNRGPDGETGVEHPVASVGEPGGEQLTSSAYCH
jgi:hypothetical protein